MAAPIVIPMSIPREFESRTTGMDDRPSVAIIANAQTPYRLHLHRRIAREIQGISLHSVFTHEVSNAPWAFSAPPEIGAISFGRNESSDRQSDVSGILREWRRGGRIIQWMKAEGVKFVVMMGYNDIGRIRIIRWCRKAGVPCYLFGDSNILGDRVGGAKAIVKRLIVTRILSQCAGVLVCGSLGKQYFAKYGVDPARMFYFPYEPDYALIENLPIETIEATRKRFGLAENRRRIVFSGRLNPVKRPELLLQAFCAIAAERPDWDLIFVGDGDFRGTTPARDVHRVSGRSGRGQRHLSFIGRAGVAERLRALGAGDQRGGGGGDGDRGQPGGRGGCGDRAGWIQRPALRAGEPGRAD